MLTATIVSVGVEYIVLPQLKLRQYTDLFLRLCIATFSDGISGNTMPQD